MTAASGVQQFHLDYFGFATLAGSRVAPLMRLYERRYAHKLTFRFVPLVSAVTSGVIHMAPDFDPSDEAPTVNIPETLAAYFGYQSARLAQSCAVTMPNPSIPGAGPVRGAVFNGPMSDIRLTSNGKLLVYVDGYSGTAGDVVGHVVIDYDFTFTVPESSSGPVLVPENDMNLTVGNSIDSTTTSSIATAGQAPYLSTSIYPHKLYTAIANFPSTAYLQDADGSDITTGTRVFFEAADAVQNATSKDVDRVTASSTYIGRMAKSALLTLPLIVRNSGGSAADITLTSVYKLD